MPGNSRTRQIRLNLESSQQFPAPRERLNNTDRDRWRGGKVGEPMLYSRSNDSGTAFEPERNLMTRTFGLDGGGIIAADSTG